MWEAILLHMTPGTSSGLSISTTEICGFFKLKSVASFSVSALMPVPFLPRAMGRATPKNDVLTHVELVAQEI